LAGSDGWAEAHQCLILVTRLRVNLTRTLPRAEVRQVEPRQQQVVNGVAQKDLGQWILAVRGLEKLLDGVLRQVQELVTGETRLAFFELILDPGLVALPGRIHGYRHCNYVTDSVMRAQV
jgi:hypothetical protein